MKSPRPTQHAFTLLELMVVMAITSIMLFLIHTVFSNSADAVRLGMAVSHIIQDTRTITDQVASDAEKILGPDPVKGGFLVILHKRYSDITIFDRTGELTGNTVRSDQLVFIREVGDGRTLTPVCPGVDGTYWNETGATHARLWYGHVRMTEPDGSDRPDLGQPGNEIATDWVLGRQALFFDANVDINDIQCNFYDHFRVDGYPSARPFFMGETDILDVNYDNPSPSGSGSAFGASDSYLDYLNKFAPVGNDNTYDEEALKFAFGVERLRVNPRPEGNTFTSRQIAGMHAYFAGHVADFEVAFAADADNDGKIDSDLVTKDIFWYDMDNLPPYPPGGVYTNGPHIDASILNNLPNADMGFVWRHDDDQGDSRWPHLIRIRYRIQDDRGLLSKWFEQIIKVDRP